MIFTNLFLFFSVELFDERLHLCLVFLCLQEEMPLVLGSYEVVLRILALPVVVTVEVIPEEAYCLHVWEELGCMRKQGNLKRGEEG